MGCEDFDNGTEHDFALCLAFDVAEQVGDKGANPSTRHMRWWGKNLMFLWHQSLNNNTTHCFFFFFSPSHLLCSSVNIHCCIGHFQNAALWEHFLQWVRSVSDVVAFLLPKAGIPTNAANPCPPYLHLEDTSALQSALQKLRKQPPCFLKPHWNGAKDTYAEHEREKSRYLEPTCHI